MVIIVIILSEYCLEVVFFIVKLNVLLIELIIICGNSDMKIVVIVKIILSLLNVNVKIL